jgi:hypothetical protein
MTLLIGIMLIMIMHVTDRLVTQTRRPFCRDVPAPGGAATDGHSADGAQGGAADLAESGTDADLIALWCYNLIAKPCSRTSAGPVRGLALCILSKWPSACLVCVV